MIHLYCLAEPGSERWAAGVVGLLGAPVRVLAAGDVDAWMSEHSGSVGAGTPELARAHDAVVRAAMLGETPLPARFGQTFEDEASLRRALAERGGALARALERVRGAVEMTIRVRLDRPAEERIEDATMPAASAGAGRVYLSRVRARQHAEESVRRQADFLQSKLGRAVNGFVREEVRSLRPSVSPMLTVAHLVARDALVQYRLALRSFTEHESRLPLMVSGPWAPYSFAELAGG